MYSPAVTSESFGTTLTTCAPLGVPDKDILESFGLAEEVKANKTNLKKYVGRTLAARVVKPWVEDFVDDATGEVITVERTEVLIKRETILENRHISKACSGKICSKTSYKARGETCSRETRSYKTGSGSKTSSEASVWSWVLSV